MTIARLCLGAALLCSLSTAALANSSVTLRDKQQAACFNDVQTLCGDFLPDEDKTEACMATKRAKVSPGCAKFSDAKPAG
jgi:hypothetical protein